MMTRSRLRRLVAPLVVAPLLACGNGPPVVPAAEPAGAECKVPTPPADAPDPAPAPGAGRLLPPPGPPVGTAQKAQKAKKLGPSGLKGLRPQDGPNPALPLSLGQMMNLRHPPSEMQWRALPPGSDAALTTMALDANEDPKARARAMEGLAVRAPEGGDQAMRTVLADPAADPASRRAAARALSYGYAEGAGLAALVAALGDDDKRLRETVVKALTPHVEKDGVRAALQARAAVEQDALVKEALTAALGG